MLKCWHYANCVNKISAQDFLQVLPACCMVEKKRERGFDAVILPMLTSSSALAELGLEAFFLTAISLRCLQLAFKCGV